jgi:hypothetical protein
MSPLTESGSHPSVTFEAYAIQWLDTHASQACKFSTHRIYEVNLRRRVLPVLGPKPLPSLSRADCRSLIAASREKGLSPKTIEYLCRTASSILVQAVEDRVLPANPAFRLGRYDRNADHPKAEIQPLT